MVCLFLLTSLAGNADQFGDFIYSVNQSTITITGYRGRDGSVVIPGTIDGMAVTSIGANTFSNSSLTSVTIPNSVTSIGANAFFWCFSLTNFMIPNGVTNIGDGAFSSCLSLTSVTIPNGVTSIGADVFHGCTNLTNVTIPQSVTSIGNGAFSGCSSLTGVTIPNGVTSIEAHAFDSCSSLTNVAIPNSVTNIGDTAFAACPSLTAITVGALNSVYSSMDGVLFNRSQTTLIQWPGGKSGSYTIPNRVSSIVDWAFYSSSSLTSVTIGNSVTHIGDHAFFTSSLTSVTIPDSITNIGDAVFFNCPNLTRVTIPNSITSIGGYAFYECTSLPSITIPESVTSIGEQAFFWCSSLTNVTIPNRVTSIGDRAFSFCARLTAINVDPLNSDYSSVDGVLFNQSLTTLIQYPGGKTGGYTVPNGVTNIGDWTFSYCSNLTRVTIPNSLTSIGRWGFYYCTNLTGVYFQGNAPSFGYNSFYQDNQATFYRLAGTTGWWDSVAIGSAPVLTDIPDQTIEAYRRWSLPVSLANASTLLQPVTFLLDSPTPKGMGIDTNTGVLTWRPAQDQAPSTNRIGVRVSQSDGAGDAKAFTIVVANPPGLPRWQTPVGAAVAVCPALGDDGTLYVVSADSQVHALDAATGTNKWSFAWPQPASGAQVWPPVIGDEGLVNVGSPTTLYALDPATGTKRWEFSGRSRWTGAPLVGTDGLLYLGGADGWVYGLDRLTGEPRRRFPSAGVPGFIDRFGILYSATDTQVFAFDTASGARLWSAQPMGDLTSSTTASSLPVMGADDTLLVANAISRGGFSYVAEGNVSALDRLTGQLKWRRVTSYDWLGVNATPIVGPGARVYTGTHSSGDPFGGALNLRYWNRSTMAVYDGTSGNPLPEIEVVSNSVPYMGHTGQIPLPPGLVNTPPAITQDNLLFVGSYNADQEVMNALDTTTGQKIWTWPAGQSASPPAVGPDGTVYFGDDQGRVHALRSGAAMGLATNAWSKFMGDAHNSGRAPGVVVSNTLVLSVPRSRTLHLGEVLTAVVAATNPALPAARYTYTLVSAPAGMTLDPTDGTLAWTPTADQAFTTNWVSVLATDDGQPATGKAEAFVIIVLGDPWTLPLAAPVEVTVRPLNTLYFSVHAANPDWPLEAPMYRLAAGAPAGMVLDTGGRITWTPGVADAGRTNRVTVQVQNAHGGEGEATVSVIVTPAGQERLPGEVVWTFPMQSPTASSPAIGADGTVYVGSGSIDKKVFALDGTTGVEKWEFPTGDSVPYAVAVGADGTVYAVSADQRLYALDGATGKKRWEFGNGTPLVADPVVGRDGKVYIYSHGVLPSQGVLALDGQTGSPVWAQPVWRMVPYLPVAIAPDGTLCCSGFLLFGANTANGVINWASSVVGAQIVQTSPYVVYQQPRVAAGSNGVLYAAADQLCALDAATGTVKWQRPGTTDPQSATNSPYTGYGSLVLGPKGVLFVAASVPSTSPVDQPRGKLVAMEAATGATLWESAETPMITSTPAIGDDGTIYAGTADGVYYAFNTTNGIIQWGMSTLKTSDKMWVSSPNIGNQGLVYFMGAGSNAVFAVKGSGSRGLARSDWPRFHGDARNTGNVATETVAPSLAFADVPLQTVAEQTLLSLNLAATNAAGSSNTLKYSLLDAPEGMVIEPASGALRWTPTEAQGPSTNRVVAKVVQDGYPPLSATNQFTVVVTEVNLAPVLTVPADQTIDPLASWTATLTAADPDVPANTLAFALGSGPAGLTLDPLTRTMNWTPVVTQASSVNQITVRVTDNGVPPLSAERSFTLTVKAVDLPPQLTTTPRAYTVFAGATLVFTNTAVDPNRPAKPFVFLLDLDQPVGATLNRDTGVFTWTAATAPATNHFTIWVTESDAPFARDSQPFTVVTLPAPAAIRISGVTRDDASHLTVRWTSLPAWRYQLEHKPRLDGSPWIPVGDPVTATGASSSQTDPQANGAQRFYRVVQVL